MGNSDQFYIKDDLVCLRLMELSDLDFYVSVYQDPQMYHLWQKKFNLVALTKAFHRSIKHNQDNSKVKKVFVVTKNQCCEQVGVASIKIDNSSGETGVIIKSEYQRNGFGLSVKRLLLKLAFDVFGSSVLSAQCHHGNRPIISINKKLGYEYESTSENNRGLEIWSINKQKYQQTKLL